MRSDLLQCSNLVSEWIANACTQTVSDLRVLLNRPPPQREFGSDRRAINGAQPGYDQRKLPEPLGAEGP